ncbi:type II/IV secretion system family protein, partial [Escherichia coli]|nr:type II/IV secretion system family protein [Escherichia coli]
MKCLREIFFSDLLISDNGYFLRYLEGESEPVIKLPMAYMDDALALRSDLEKKYKEEGKKEFFYSYMDIPYRAAVVATIDGEGYFLRRLKLPVPNINTLGFPDATLATLKSLGKSRGG